MYSNTAEFRRANRQESYQHIPRDEYLIRVHEFAPRGSKLATKVNEQMVKEIRINMEGMTDKQRAEKLGISPVTVYKIRKRERWGHI